MLDNLRDQATFQPGEEEPEIHAAGAIKAA